MKAVAITSKNPKVNKTASVEVQYAETIDEALQVYGEEAILSNAFANWRVTLQAAIRSMLGRDMTEEQIQEELKDAKMGVSRAPTKADPKAALIAKFKNSTPEEQAQLIQQLKEAAGL